MSSRPRSPATRPMRRRLKSQRRRFCRAQKKSYSRTAVNGGGACSSLDVSDKLEALESLIPAAAAAANGERKPDQLFRETADYIVLLKTQVSILQRLVDFYGSSDQNQNAV